jgi:hypothetical protein
MWQEPSETYRLAQRERYIRKRWARAPWFRDSDLCQELGRLSKDWSLRRLVARWRRYCRAKEKRLWRDNLWPR